MRLRQVTHQDFLNQTPALNPLSANRLLTAIVQTGTCKRVSSAFPGTVGLTLELAGLKSERSQTS
jgi:hypothetical protein